MAKTKISALLITYNEEEHIEEVITNISFADEIIVVDSFSNDKTIELLKTFKNVTLFQKEFIDFTSQRNYAISKANYDWILFIDADERIPEKLRTEIIDTVKQPKDNVAFMFIRKFYFNKKVIHYSGYQSDTTYRLFKKGHAFYDKTKLVHEIPIIDGKSSVFKNHMLHYSFKSANAFKEKIEHYAILKAKELYKKGKKSTILHFLFRPCYKFFINYFIRLGFLDGKEGFIICYINAYGVYFRYKKLKQLWLKKDGLS